MGYPLPLLTLLSRLSRQSSCPSSCSDWRSSDSCRSDLELHRRRERASARPQASGVSTENHLPPRSHSSDDGGSVVSRRTLGRQKVLRAVRVVRLALFLYQFGLHGACCLLPVPTKMVTQQILSGLNPC